MIDFISEVSSNHSRDLNRCFDFVRTSKEAGCTSVKFQLFKIDQLFHPDMVKLRPDIAKRKNWELPEDFIPKLSEKCREYDIKFSCTPFYLKAVDVLADHVDFFKIASYELLWAELFTKCSQTGLPIVFSTGMATIPEVEQALAAISLGQTKDVTILHCTSSYPTPVKDANLNVIDTLRSHFTKNFKHLNIKIGWSDHTVNPGVIYRAIHKHDACAIEFHLDLDGNGEEYKSGHCWLPQEIGSVIKEVQSGFLADGRTEKGHTPSEEEERFWRADPSDGLRPLPSRRSEEWYLKNRK